MGAFALWRAIGAAYLFVFGRPLRFLKVAWPWFVVVVAADFAIARLYHTMLPRSLGKFMLVQLGIWLLSLAVFVAVSVAIHRAILRSEAFWSAALRFGRRQWRFLGIGIVIALVMLVPLFLVVQTLGVVMAGLFIGQKYSSTLLTALFAFGAVEWLVALALWFLGNRMILALPAAALDEDQPISRAWSRSQKGNAWRLFAGSLCCALPVTAVQSIVERFLPVHPLGGMRFNIGTGSLTVKEGWFAGDAIQSAFLMLEFAILVAFYSYAYQQITSEERSATALCSDVV